MTALFAQLDGHNPLVWIQPLLARVNWDPFADFAPVSLAISAPNVLVVHPSLPVKSVKELIALARAQPGQLNYGAGGAGSAPHVAAELFRHMAKIDIVRVNYKGSGPAHVGLLTGEVQLMFAGVGPITPHVKARRLKALAVTTPVRTRLMPELPPVAETLPGYDAQSAIGFFLPRKTPPAIVSYLNREIVQALKGADPDKLFTAGVEVVASSPDEFSAFMKTETTRMGEVIRGGRFTN